jgi:hypothetical protein
MSIAKEKTMRHLRMVWISCLDGSLRIAWVDESLLVGRAPMGAGCHG